MPVPAETGFIEFKGWCPFKFENKTSAAKWQSMSYWLIPLLTHLTFHRTMPLIIKKRTYVYSISTHPEVTYEDCVESSLLFMNLFSQFHFGFICKFNVLLSKLPNCWILIYIEVTYFLIPSFRFASSHHHENNALFNFVVS